MISRFEKKELASLKDKDEQMMAFLAGGEIEEFHRFICDESNSRRVCGYPALYTFLSVLPEKARAGGRVLKYGQWPDANGTVTFGSLAFGSAVIPAKAGIQTGSPLSRG